MSKTFLRCVGLLVVLAGAASSTQAGVSSSLTGPASIYEGGSASFVANIWDTGPPSGYDGEYITSINFTFYSGDGQSFSSSYSGLNSYSLSLSHSFSYASAGDYSASFVANVTTADPYHQYQPYQYPVSYSYSCGFLNAYTCYGTYYETGYQTIYGTSYLGYGASAYTGIHVAALNPSSVTASIPEPETYAMMLAGLGLLGFIAKRRNRQV